MALAVGDGVPVVVCRSAGSGSGSDSDHDHQRIEQVAAAVDVEVESPPAALQLRRRSAKYEATTWDYDSICSLRRPADLPLGLGSQARQEEADDEDAIINHLQLQLVDVATTDISSESETDRPELLLSQAEASLKLKESVRRLLQVQDKSDSSATSSRLLIRTIHQLQSLGVAYHFEHEIRDMLVSMHHRHHDDLDLHSAALLFRMLRQMGIPASTDMLMSALMREEDDHRQRQVITDRDGLLALYQASYLAFPGETTAMDQVRAFAVDNLAGRERDDGDTRLLLPLHWTAPRLQAMWSLNKDDDDHHSNDIDPAILQLAQLDFNLVQALHRRELAEVTRWWKESRLGDSCRFARDRVVECFFCAACIAPEPRLAECREVLAKTAALIVHLDDIYDVYGTPDELQAFTDAIAGWEHGHDTANTLPEYMKAMYSAIRTTSVAAADRVLEKHGYDMLPLYKKAWHELCKAFLVEARWQQQGHVPTFAEYVSNGWVTSTGPLLLLHALPAAAAPIIRSPQANKADDNSAAAAGIDCPNPNPNPRLVELASTIFRLCNDCASHEAEAERGDAPSSIACCMAEAWCAGEEQARAAVKGVIAETWKALNWEVVAAAASGSDNKDLCCCSSPPPPSAAETTTTESMTATTMANLCLNLARIIHCIYQDGDGITSPTHRVKHMVKDLLFNPIRRI